MRRSKLLLLSLALVTIPIPSAVAQTSREMILIRSWKEGNGAIAEMKQDIALRRQKKVSFPVAGAAGRKYVLTVKYFAPTERQLEYWIVEFREILRLRAGRRLGENLLVPWKPGPGGHYFPRGDFIGYLYPRKNYDYLVGGTPWTDGAPFYPIDAVRKIRVEGFSVTLEVLDVETRMTSSGKGAIRTLRVSYENGGESNGT